jgi:hypothetical protein
MGKRIIRLTENELAGLVKKVIQEQASMTIKGSIGKAVCDFAEAKKRNYQVFEVKGSPKTGGKVISKGTKLGPLSIVEMRKGDNIMMGSVSPADKGKYFQGVELYVNENGKLELFVNRA